MWNEFVCLLFFLKYYCDMGVNYFLFVDNESDDDSFEYLKDQLDVLVWCVDGSYKWFCFGMDWQNWLFRKYVYGYWCVVVDFDEFFVYLFCDMCLLCVLIDWLDVLLIKLFLVMLLDFYFKGLIFQVLY